MDESIRQRAIELYDAYTHEGRDRRSFMRDMTLLAGSVAAAEALIAGIAASPAAAAILAPDDKRLKTRTERWETAPGRPMSGYVAEPAGRKAGPLVVVIHENRGLNDHIRDVARRVALEGYLAVAPDLLAPLGGTPSDENNAREMIGALDLAATVKDAQSAFARFSGGRKSGLTGFCWGGAMVDRLAVSGAPGLAAAVSYYGPAPDPREAAKLAVPLMIHLPELDARVAGTVRPFVAALKAAGKPVTLHEYAGANHAFNNDTSAERYNEAAAKLAWQRTMAFFKTHLV
ncbi:dienelactone hydrolase family protein [Sphingomonas sp. ID1715]|uniref:dienelactone hydrolase family protein n=1 Tax=Sphingomonas sp. ID1715 TaxID=1656898 RepID=UPI0014894461|nr:dienelactone hydrolase family protein [Sphingomonas sp. ID1715]NNM77412.1 dienelactone hydrolase family protein [Sphingomonas sp. ID1715]